MQTAVEFLENEIKKLNISVDGAVQVSTIRIFEQAKEMEKQQIIDAINDVSRNNVIYANKVISSFSGIEGELFRHNENLAEQYYNDTYGSKGSDETKQ